MRTKTQPPNHRQSNNQRSLAGQISHLAANTPEELVPEARPLAWWFLIFPGRLLLWIDYIFPNSITGAIGSARRKNVIGIQIVSSILVLTAILIFLTLFILSFFLEK